MNKAFLSIAKLIIFQSISIFPTADAIVTGSETFQEYKNEIRVIKDK
jgi:hypothetical protein